MKEYTEKVLAIGEDPESAIEQIEQTAREMFLQGWYFLYSETDRYAEKIYLFFEREVYE
jgi:hypothetical protein